MLIYVIIGIWTDNSRCSQIIQSYADQNERLLIACEHSVIGLLISYFDEDKPTDFPELCISDATLDRIIEEKFLSVNIPLPSTSDLNTANENSAFSQEIRRLEHELKTELLLIVLEQRCIHLFGFTEQVKDVQQRIEHGEAELRTSTGTERARWLREGRWTLTLFR